MKNRVIIAALAFGALAGCTKESSSVATSGDSQVKFTSASIATRTVDNEWESGDKIGITTSGMSYVDYLNMQHSATTDGSTTTFDPIDSDNTIFYVTGQMSDIKFYAYYPYSTEDVEFFDYVTIDISDQKDDMGAVDFMTAVSTWSVATDNSETPIAFDFEHRLSQVIFSLTYYDEVGIDWDNEEDNSYAATINNVVRSKAYSILNGEEYNDEIADELTSFDLTTSTDGTMVSAILHPGEIDATVELLINGETFTFALQEEALISGKSYFYYVTVGREKIIVSESTITDWDTTIDATDFNGYQNNGDGTRNNPYQIYTEEELLRIGSLEDEYDWYGDDHYILMNDITLSQTYEGPIFASEIEVSSDSNSASKDHFNGTFDGNGHTITNPILEDWTASEYAFAIFETIGHNGEVFDLNVYIEDTYCFEALVGAIALTSHGVVENCSCEGALTSIEGGDIVYVVAANFGSVIDCTNSVVVKDDVGLEYSQSANIVKANDEDGIIILSTDQD